MVLSSLKLPTVVMIKVKGEVGITLFGRLTAKILMLKMVKT